MSNEEMTHLVQKVHDTLYKYSHERLEYFCQTPALAFLFEHFYSHGAAVEKGDAAFNNALEKVHNLCK